MPDCTIHVVLKSSLVAGRWEGPPARWDRLCGDLREAVLGKLSLQDLARAAATCREFQQAWEPRAADERANLIAVAEEEYGKRLLSTFVTVLQRPICGLRARAVVINKDSRPRVSPIIETLVTNDSEPRYGTRGDLYNESFHGGHYGVIRESFSECQLLEAFIHYPVVENGKRAAAFVTWDVSRFGCSGCTNVRLDVAIGEEGRLAALGLLLAVCLDMPKEIAASARSPLTINLDLIGLRNYAARMREAQDMVAALRPLADSVTITCHPDPRPVLVARKSHAGPLGVLNVRVP
jgi:hypothetical protein